jgi:hypothetical protein
LEDLVVRHKSSVINRHDEFEDQSAARGNAYWMIALLDPDNNYPKLPPSGKTPGNLGEKRCATPLFNQISGLLMPGGNLS